MEKVFPAYAGVFPFLAILLGKEVGLPRIRGGVSLIMDAEELEEQSSPHTRGCFR